MNKIKLKIESLKQKLNLQSIKQQIAEIEQQSTQPGFWKDHEKAAKAMKKLTEFQKEVKELEDLEQLLVEGREQEAERKLKSLETKTYLAGQYDRADVIFAVHAGQGGVEAMDWAQMLERMYARYFERKGWQYEVINQVAGEEAGIKSVTMTVADSYVYGYLKHEAGSHRLVRQSPFNADRLRQTSFALVEVLPQIEEESEVEISEDDLEWQFFRASTQGGQNVQKVSTAVRLRHRPTGLIVTCQTQRYQEQNRKIALQLLRAKLWEVKEKKRQEEEVRLKQGRTKASWGTQIRSYVLHPYKLVKDLRTNYETNEVELVLDGHLDDFIEAELQYLS